METLLTNYLSVKLQNNELLLIEDILKYIRCIDCNKIECSCIRCESCIKKIVSQDEGEICICDVCRNCETRGEDIFICTGRCDGDMICYGCSSERRDIDNNPICDDCYYESVGYLQCEGYYNEMSGECYCEYCN